MNVERPPRVLVVDDNRDAADSLSLVLQMLGYEVRTFYSGDGAVEAAREFSADCIVLDIGLPRTSGYEVARKVREDEQLKHVKLIALTAYTDEPRARAAGFDRHFVKPIDPLVLQPILEEMHKMGKQIRAAEELVHQQGKVVADARELMTEIKEDIKEVKQELREVKQDVKELRDEVRKNGGE
jgi:two-component system OmpR family response regulator